MRGWPRPPVPWLRLTHSCQVTIVFGSAQAHSTDPFAGQSLEEEKKLYGRSHHCNPARTIAGRTNGMHNLFVSVELCSLETNHYRCSARFNATQSKTKQTGLHVAQCRQGDRDPIRPSPSAVYITWLHGRTSAPFSFNTLTFTLSRIYKPCASRHFHPTREL